ncbi:MAG TPA: hypothetical protein VNA12_05335 [Mycobacteriales bacterium]|nr:hypothetical protein [Mycobacteriales bacterium]
MRLPTVTSAGRDAVAVVGGLVVTISVMGLGTTLVPAARTDRLPAGSALAQPGLPPDLLVEPIPLGTSPAVRRPVRRPANPGTAARAAAAGRTTPVSGPPARRAPTTPPTPAAPGAAARPDSSAPGQAPAPAADAETDAGPSTGSPTVTAAGAGGATRLGGSGAGPTADPDAPAVTTGDDAPPPARNDAMGDAPAGRRAEDDKGVEDDEGESGAKPAKPAKPARAAKPGQSGTSAQPAKPAKPAKGAGADD